MSDYLIYITASDAAEALSIGRDLVERRLAACANAHGPVTSIYRWQNEMQQVQETVLIAKTTADLVERHTERVVEIHSYECPGVVSVPITGGHLPFLEWIDAETDT
jgi:periplasmic divalent cation tolerance protein